LNEHPQPQKERPINSLLPAGFWNDPPDAFRFFVWTFPIWWPALSLFPVICLTAIAYINGPSTSSFSQAASIASLFWLYMPVIFYASLLAKSHWFRTKGFFVIGYWLFSFFILSSFYTQGAFVGAIEKSAKSVAKQLIDIKSSK
jgi:hypothetical protein